MWLKRTRALWWRRPAGSPPHCGSSCLGWRHSPPDLPCPGCLSERPRRPGPPSSCSCRPWWARSPPRTGNTQDVSGKRDSFIVGSVAMAVSHLVVHELQREGRLPHAAAAHHDHLVENQRGLALVFAGGHDSGLQRKAPTDVKTSKRKMHLNIHTKRPASL